MPETKNALFATTRWTMVSEAGANDTGDALEQLCQTYWFPLYAYLRRTGETKENAEDLTQGFFLQLLERRDLADLDREKGKFRSFLLASLKHYVSNNRIHKRARKRGGSIDHLPLDWESGDARFSLSDESVSSPDIAFDREWATALLERVLVNLEQEFSEGGKEEYFGKLRIFLTCEKGEIPYEEVALSLGIKPTALRVAIHRLRKRYRALLKNEVAKTITDADSLKDELAILSLAFSR